MNIYEKLQKMRVDLQGMNIKKSGKNKHMGYDYYELSDILPPINRLMLANKVASLVTFADDFARLKIIDCEKPEEFVEFTSPMAGATLKGAHDIQNLGAVETYQRRYLYMTAFEVVESDFFDATQGAPQTQPKKGTAPVKKLSEDMSAKLNEAVTAFSEISGKNSKEILDMIRNETGKTPKTMDDSDGFEVLALIHRWSDEEVEKLGV